MKTYILDSINRLKRYGENLDVKTILCNKSWQIFNDSGEKELYIFQENGDILLSTNGIVSQGKWQYISANKSILMSVKENSYMLHPSFTINNIIAMNLDGTDRYMLMIEEQSLLALQVKNLEDLNRYFLSIENEDIQKKKEEKQREEEEKLKQEALKEWFANKKQILDSNKEYRRNKKKFKSYIVACLLAPIVSFLFFMNSWDTEIVMIIGTVIILCSLLFPIIEICFYDSKCDKISEIQKKIYIENYIKEKRK